MKTKIKKLQIDDKIVLKPKTFLGLCFVKNSRYAQISSPTYVRLFKKVKARVTKINAKSVTIDLIANKIAVFSKGVEPRNISLKSISSVRIPFFQNEFGNTKVKTKRINNPNIFSFQEEYLD